MDFLATLRDRFAKALEPLVEDSTPYLDMIRPSQDAKFGDFQANMAMPLKGKLGKNPRDIAAEIVENLDVSDRCEPPAVAGHPIFERYHRVHQNTLENLVIFLPGLWLFATYVSAQIAAVLGAVFVVGRAVYARLYVKDPPRRGPGVMLSFPVAMILLIGGTLGALFD